jgi:hypothetical protein
MYYDLGFADWTFEIERTGKAQVADRLRAIWSDYPRANAELGSGMERIGKIYAGSTATIRRLLDAGRQERGRV